MAKFSAVDVDAFDYVDFSVYVGIDVDVCVDVYATEFQGALIAGLNKRNGLIMATDLNDDGSQICIRADVPLVQMFGYSESLPFPRGLPLSSPSPLLPFCACSHSSPVLPISLTNWFGSDMTPHPSRPFFDRHGH